MTDEEPTIARKWSTDRPSARTDEEREQHYRDWCERQAPYIAAIEEAGDKPWFSSDAERRELFMRRYRRPSLQDTA